MWNAKLYDDRHAFVWQRGADLLDLLAPQTDERILDIGCGTAHLTQQIAQSGARVIGLDSSPEMIERARGLFPELDLRVGDAADFAFDEPFDAIFSNATLHWVRPPQDAVFCMARALPFGGRLVVEFGGKGNVARVLASLQSALHSVGVEQGDDIVNYFPSIGEYASLLEAHDLEVESALLFERPTPLDGPRGLRDWVTMFRAPFVEMVPLDQREMFWQKLENEAAPQLLLDEIWHADYRRLRIVARRR